MEEGSVAYGEIPLVADRFGSLLLQVKDRKTGNQKVARKGKATSKAPLVTDAQVVEEHNHQELLHYAPPSDTNEDPGAFLDNFEPLPDISKFQAHAPRPLTNDLMPQNPFPSQVHAPHPLVNQLMTHMPAVAHPLRDIGPRKEVRFGLLPAAEISSIPNGPSGDNRMAEIERLKAQLAALQGGHKPIKENNTPYNILDVSMDQDDETLPVITLRAPNINHQRLFQFEKGSAPLPRGETGRHHASSQQARNLKPGISSTLFYQGVNGPPSARSSKGKQRALPSSVTAEERHVSGHPPSSPLQNRDAYVRQRLLTNKSAGPSRKV